MKKLGLIFAISLCFSFLVGCGGRSSSGTSLPTTKYEKVQYAMDGVEKSLKNQKAATRNLGLQPRAKRSEADALNAIYNIFSDGTAGQPDFKYDEPPMIQFQYIKKTLEKIGGSFNFGVKYQETITGSIYYDFSTGKDGEEVQQAEFKQNYSLDFSLYINIDDNDLITCKTLFDIDYTHDNDVHHQVFYAELFLDYDMKKTDANYKLKLYAVDDCSDYRVDEERYFSAEYDYVDVSSDAINEWGKIGYSTNKAIALDETHDSLADYLSDADLKFKPTIQLYRNGKSYQRNQLNDEQAIQAVTIACDELGVNSTDVKYKEYIEQPSTSQPVLKTCYEEFSRIFGRDLAYNLVYTGAKEEDHGGGEGGDNDRVDSTWPTQELIDDGYGDVPGFLSKTATFDWHSELSEDTGANDYYITVLNYQDEDFYRYIRTLIENGFVETKQDDAAVYLHLSDSGDGQYDYAVAIIRNIGVDMILVSKVVNQDQPKEAIIIQNAYDYTGAYSSYEDFSCQNASDVAAVVTSVSGGQISADAIAQYVIASSSKSYKIYFDLEEFSGADVKDNFLDYVKLYANWNVIVEGSAFYTTVNGIDVLIMADKNSSEGYIEIHSFAFSAGSIAEIMGGQGHGGEGGGEGGGQGGGTEPLRATVSLFEVDEKSGSPKFVETREFNDGEIINVEEMFGPGKYFRDEGCSDSISGDIEVHAGMNIYRKIGSQEQTQGNIIIYDVIKEEELFTFTDVIGATIKGGSLFNYVLYKDEACSSMVGLDEEITVSAEPLTLYCKDYSSEDYVTLEVNLYINGFLSPYHITQHGVRKGEILNNYSSNSFPAYYSTASYYDSNFTMTLNDEALASYSSDLVAFTDNAVLNIYCNNDWCNIYHFGSGDSKIEFLWEGFLGEGDTVLVNSKYYRVSSVNGSSANYDDVDTAYTYTLHSVLNGKIITTQKDYFPIIDGQGMSFIITDTDNPMLFLDKELTTPLMPEEGKNEVVFNHSFTLYQPFTR